MSPITRSQTKKIQKQQSSLILSLPEELLMHCIALVPKQNYRNLSRVCKLFRSIVTSTDLFVKRSLLKCTESCIYVPLRDRDSTYTRWYTLIHKENGDKKLVHITSLPPLPCSRQYVAFGSKIFVVGGLYGEVWKSDVSVIDCRFDISKSLGKMPELVTDPVASDVVDGKIYVIGGEYSKSNRNKKKKNQKPDQERMLMLDTEAETWEYDMRSGLKDDRWVIRSVAVDGKIYVTGVEKMFVFDPKEGKWEELLADDDSNADESLASVLGWGEGCIVNEILYRFDMVNGCIRAYDLKQRLYLGIVKGVEGLTKYGCMGSVVTCCSGEKKLMMLLLLQDCIDICKDGFKIWCAEIALMEKNERGEIWGNVEWFQLVHEGWFYFTDCLTVTV